MNPGLDTALPAGSPGAVPPPPEALVLARGRELIGSLSEGPRWSLERLNEFAVDRVAEDEELRAALFRMVDVTPMCSSSRDISVHLAALLGEIRHPGRIARLGHALVKRPALSRPAGVVARSGVRGMASRFIAGADAGDSLDELSELWGRGVATTVDLLGEATVTEEEADRYARRCEETLRTLHGRSLDWPERPRLERDRHGPLPRVNLSVKVSALTPESRPDAPERGMAGAADRLRGLLRVARDLDAHLHIDMESLDLRETVTDLVFALLSEPEFRYGPSAGLVLQGYLRDSPEELDRWFEWLETVDRASPLTVRLVKGAYWDQEVVEAEQAGWVVPVFTERRACDRNFEILTRRLLGNLDRVRPAIASHNLRSIAHAMAAAEHAGIDRDDIEYQVLRGLGDDIQDALAARSFRVRTYSPIGDLIAGMAYLVRRLLENTSNDSFLRARSRTDNLDSLLVAP